MGQLRRLRIACRYDAAGIELGASVAHAGVCLTVVEVAPVGNRTAISVDLGAETLRADDARRDWRPGTRLNMERSLRMGDELGGHMVSGHADGVAEIIWRRDFDGMAHFKFRAPAALAKFIAQKGSVALDGTSLTVNAGGWRRRLRRDPADSVQIRSRSPPGANEKQAIASTSRSTRWRATPRDCWRRAADIASATAVAWRYVCVGGISG